MVFKNMDNTKYVGSMTLPGDREPQSVEVFFQTTEKAISVQFPEQEDSTEWQGGNVVMIERLKFDEITFASEGIPVPGVELSWRIHADKDDGTAAGVITVKPNDKKISGDKGFILYKAT